jgi:uncharacterized protein
MNMLTLFFSADMYGSEICWKKVVNAGALFGADVLIVSGNLIGSGLQPLLRTTGASWTTRLPDGRIQANSTRELEEVEKRLRAVGLYPCRMSREEAEELVQSESAWNRRFEELARQSLELWLEWAAPKLRADGRRLCVMPGGDDPLFVDDILRDNDTVELVQGEMIALDQHHQMLSENSSNQTPARSVREIEEERLYELLEARLRDADQLHSAVFNIHPPPRSALPRHGTGFDMGSDAVRRLIETYQPLLGLHSSRGIGQNSFARIGRTLCLFPGSTGDEGQLSGFVVTLDKNEIRDFQPVRS